MSGCTRKKRKPKGDGDGLHVDSPPIWIDHLSQDQQENPESTKDDMNLETLPLFPNEVSQMLQERIEGLEKEKEVLSEKLRLAEDKLKAASPLKNLGRSSDLAANKIVELSKKVRELTAELAKANNRAEEAQVQLISMEKEKKCQEAEDDRRGDTLAEVKDLTEKLNSANSKLCESRNQCQQLKHELKLAHKALTNELGENVPIQTALSSGWRGRAQQIISLQQKVNELNEKLSQKNISNPVNARMTEKNREDQKEVESLKGELEETRKKLESSKVRLKSVSNELVILRTRNESLLDKSVQDQQAIASLNAQLGNGHEKSKDQISLNKLEQQLSSLRKELSQERMKNEQMLNVISEKDSKISILQGKLNTSVMQSYPGDQSEKCHTSMDKDSSNNVVTSAAVEAERLRLMELVSINHRRLEDERNSMIKLEEQLRMERHRCVRLETKVARLELERVGWTKGLYKKAGLKSSEKSDADWDLLKDKVELFEEKCLVLENKLKCLQQEKEEDSKRFLVLIEETRNSYMEQIKLS